MTLSSALLSALICALPASVESQGHRTSGSSVSTSFVVTAPTGEEMVDESALPKAWDWRNVGGRSFVVPAVNQHLPQYCASCYIHGTVGALNDRIKVQRDAKFPDVLLSRQVLLDCVPGPNFTAPSGCNGGAALMVHDYLVKNKIPDDTCKPYLAKQSKCEEKCMNCYSPGVAKEKHVSGADVCFAVPHWTGYGVSNHGAVVGEVAMMKEIYARGPIVCQLATDDEFMLNFTQNALQHEGVYSTRTKFNTSQIDHDMSVTGWGETSTGRKYWIIRNSWGTYWGSAGWLLLERGTNQMLIESAPCLWATPTSDELELGLEGRVWGDYVSGAQLLPAGRSVSLVAGTNFSMQGVICWLLFALSAVACMAHRPIRTILNYSHLVQQRSLLG